MKSILINLSIVFLPTLIFAQNKKIPENFNKYLGKYEPINNKSDRILGHVILKSKRYFITFSKSSKFLPVKEIIFIEGLKFKIVSENIYVEFCQNEEKNIFLILKGQDNTNNNVEIEMIKLKN
ncbi:hypothetical protein Emtol_3400 [Emticicia oligotrophica DSM 17448]|uniref:DUF3471 domain-containing protein n=1 Tax=Emticicia oligotrophica (strain DSM 17448 / CIP 109782 / MTCC 6937 / GPTSA100-15) TaxID=929562 RepID=A0ABN4AQ95_EMTOG|nr:hypothetical protein [Emticicia oligotrophica]AFK04529.1 hypothetical protein Emtol_3400 [Emticicia oligotrophica DSM 17448]